METYTRQNKGLVKFGDFCLDFGDERLWRQQEAIPLSPKAFAVLCYLVNHAGQLVAKEAIFDVVWPETAVGESVLTVAIRELRRMLGDQARSPQFIETVHRRGYRFIASITLLEPPSVERQLAEIEFPTSTHSPVFVGREAELTQLSQWLAGVRNGTRQVGFIAGEPGIGKTTLVDAFVAQVASTETVWIAHGQCIEHYGTGEAYLPVLEALSRLGRGSRCAPLKDALRHYAPSWLPHLPTLQSPDDREHVAPTESKVSHTRMLRELTEALEALTVARPLVLILEDLHWSDNATLEWLAYVARRRDPARLLVLGTYRPVEVSMQAHALGRVYTELLHHEQCGEIVLDYLSKSAVESYVRRRLNALSVATELVSILHRHTTGNPLFLTTVVDELRRRGWLTEKSSVWGGPEGPESIIRVVPASLRHMIEQHVEQLSSDEQVLLEAASLEGHIFTVAAVAAAVMQPEATIEARCTTWSRQARFVQPCEPETWPDGTVTARYRFIHALYHEVVYGRVSAGQRVRMQQQIGSRKERGYGAEAVGIAAELALHFTQAQNTQRAVVYLQHAVSNAIQRAAYAEAHSHIAKGMELLGSFPHTPERTRHELTFQIALGSVLSDTKGWMIPEVEQAYTRALELCRQLDDPPETLSVLYGLGGVYEFRGEYDKAEVLYYQRHRMAQHSQDTVLLIGSHEGLACSVFHQGKFTQTLVHTDQGLALYTPQYHRALTIRYGRDGGVACHNWASRALWFLGYVDQSLSQSHASRRLALEHAHPYTVAIAYNQAAQLHQFRLEAQEARKWAEVVIAQATEQGSSYRIATGTILLGWALATQGQREEGVAHLQQGLEMYQVTGAAMDTPYFLGLLADAYHRIGLVDKGLAEVTRALGMVRNGRGFFCEAELYRLKGELLLNAEWGIQNAERTPADCFHQSLSIARHQQSKSLELRAATSLARLWQRQGKHQEAYNLLQPVYNWFTEGFDTADLKEARVLLQELETL